MALSDSEFSAKFFAAATVLEKIKLAIEQDRFSIWFHPDKPNLLHEYLLGILELPADYKVKAKPRKSRGAGLPQVYEMTYPYRRVGVGVTIYFKGYFETAGRLVVELRVQSLREEK